MTEREAIIVFAKRPEAGKVKTRLAEELSEEEAARLYGAFLEDALVQYAGLGRAVRLYMAPPGVEEGRSLPEGVSPHLQQGDGLGARMLRAFVETFGAGFERAAVVGTDHPTLPSAFVEAAFELLREPLALTIGPSEDGGYYLLGMSDLYPSVFEGMTYSHDRVFAETLARVRKTDAHLSILPRWYDVDTPEDLVRLARDLEERSGGAEQTRRVLAELREAHPGAGW